MTRKVPPPQLGTPGETYDKVYMLTLTRAVSTWMASQQSVGDEVLASLRLVNFPTDGSGLPAGQVWVDGDGFLRMVRVDDVFAAPQAVQLRVGNVRVQ